MFIIYLDMSALLFPIPGLTHGLFEAWSLSLSKEGAHQLLPPKAWSPPRKGLCPFRPQSQAGSPGASGKPCGAGATRCIGAGGGDRDPALPAQGALCSRLWLGGGLSQPGAPPLTFLPVDSGRLRPPAPQHPPPERPHLAAEMVSPRC